MAVTQDEERSENGSGGGGSSHGALKAAAAAAATGAATLAVRKVMSHGDSSSSGDGEGEQKPKKQRSSSQGSSIFASAGASAWEAASGALLPLAEDAAEAAGKYLAEKAPDVVRERIVPRFIEAFNEAD
jgi:hypothetical protein